MPEASDMNCVALVLGPSDRFSLCLELVEELVPNLFNDKMVDRFVLGPCLSARLNVNDGHTSSPLPCAGRRSAPGRRCARGIFGQVHALGGLLKLLSARSSSSWRAHASSISASSCRSGLIGEAGDAGLRRRRLHRRPQRSSDRPVIPSKSNRKTPRACDFALYGERNLIERFFNTLKHFRAIATRYDKLAKTFLAGVQLACATILLN
jgi:transposase